MDDVGGGNDVEPAFNLWRTDPHLVPHGRPDEIGEHQGAPRAGVSHDLHETVPVHGWGIRQGRIRIHSLLAASGAGRADRGRNPELEPVDRQIPRYQDSIVLSHRLRPPRICHRSRATSSRYGCDEDKARPLNPQGPSHTGPSNSPLPWYWGAKLRIECSFSAGSPETSLAWSAGASGRFHWIFPLEDAN